MRQDHGIAGRRSEGIRLALTAPLTERLATDLYVHDCVIRFFGFKLHRRMTVIRLEDGRLFVHSPNPLDSQVRQQLDALGDVAFVVAPNKMHNCALDEFAQAYPSATFFAAPGLRERRPDLHFDRVLSDQPEPEWEANLDQAALAGNDFFSEIVFLHRATNTLIVTDFLENLCRESLSPWGRFVTRVFGVYGKPAPSPEHSLYLSDPDALEDSLRRVREWQFDRIVLAHGRCIESDGRQVLDGVVKELLKRARRRSSATRWLYRRLAKLQ